MPIKFLSRPQVPSRRAVIVIGLFACLLGAATLPFVSASCHTQRTKAGEMEARERLRTLARNGTLPSETVVAGIESEYAGTTTGALARIVRARIKFAANDFAGAAALLDANMFRQQTAISDAVLWLRAQALEKAGRRVEARAADEQLARDYPASLRAREAMLRDAQLALQDDQAAAVAPLLKKLTDEDAGDAWLLVAQAYRQQGDTTRARDAYRRLYFFAPASDGAKEAAAALVADGAGTSPLNATEALTRANKLDAAKHYAEAADAYAEAFKFFPKTADAPSQLRRGVAAFNAGARRLPDAIAALNSVPAAAGETRAEALFYLAQADAKTRQWNAARAATDELRRAFSNNAFAKRALVAVGLIARDAKAAVEADYFLRTAVNSYPGAVEVAQAQFEIAWAAHLAKNYAESSRLLLEHLAVYADRNTDNRGRAGYWAGRDLERAGRMTEARAIYQAMQQRYDANWYGYLAQRRLDALRASAASSSSNFASDSPISRAVANLGTVSVAAESAGAAANEQLVKADQLNIVGLDDDALGELNEALESAPDSPRLNLAKARILRARNANVEALKTLQKSYPDYAQMKPEELSREEWDVFYPLTNWDAIAESARARGIDPYTVAGLIRQESVFDPRAVSSAKAYGLMQLLPDTARRTARKYGITDQYITGDTLFEPRLNIQIGTAYLKDQLARFGRIEYVAAAYNAGPERAARWRIELPAEIDEWDEAVPFKETRNYVQGVVRNQLQYRRLYDERGLFRPAVGTRPVRPALTNAAAPVQAPTNGEVRPRRVAPEEEEEQ